MGPYNSETCKLYVTSREYDKIQELKMYPRKLADYIILVREAFQIPPYKEISLEVENESVF